jgi:hypothetical protein
MDLIADISKKSWKKIDGVFNYFSIELYFGFKKNGKLPVTFNELSFGCTLSDNDGIINEKQWPLHDAIYVSSDQECIESHAIDNLVPDKEYTLHVWAKNAGEKWEETFAFILPRPTSPYPSWIYDENKHVWKAPIEAPQEGLLYIWNEDNQEWEQIESI